MKVSEAIESRLSARAFLEDSVNEETVRGLLARAARSPSGGNLQPWKVYALGGESLREFRRQLADLRKTKPAGEGSEYEVYPPKLKEPYRTRRFRIGEMLYATLKIPREDKAGRFEQFGRNFEFFSAPAALFFTIDREMRQGQWADLGMFMQNIMLLAREEGLHTCAQESWAMFSGFIRRFFSIPDEEMVFCGMAIGYIEGADPVNSLRSERADVEEFAKFRF